MKNLISLGSAAISFVILSSSDVIACSWIAPPLKHYVELSRVIAVGTITEASDTEATLSVTSYLKGNPQKSQLLIDNQTYDTGATCTPLIAVGHHRFNKGQQVLMFLDTEAQQNSNKQLWHPVGVSDEAAFPVQDGRLQPGFLNLSLYRTEGKPVTLLSEARDAIATIAGPSVEIQQPKRSAWPLLLTPVVLGGSLLIIFSLLTINYRKSKRSLE